MEELRKYYVKRLAHLTVIIGALVFSVSVFLMPILKSIFGPDHWSASWVTNILRLVIISLFYLGEKFIRKRLWKSEKPEYNIDGEWEGITTYERGYNGSANVPFEKTHKVKFKQDCLNLKIATQEGIQYVNWGSHAINLIDNETLRYAYRVKYKNGSEEGNEFPGEAIGYEEMSVVEWDKKRPKKLTGDFYHCVKGEGPWYRGTVSFERVLNNGTTTTENNNWVTNLVSFAWIVYI